MLKNKLTVFCCLILCISGVLCGCISAEPLSSTLSATTQTTTSTTEHITTSRNQETALSKTSFTSTETTSSLTTDATLPSSPTTLPSAANGKRLIQIPTIHQFPEYPTGCESVAAVMALRYAGVNTSVANFIDNHLACSQKFYYADGIYYGPSPYEYFLGNPRSENSYGCMAPVIYNALVSIIGRKERVLDVTGQELSTLCDTYINSGVPVMVWVSIGMVPIKDGATWILPNGNSFTWPKNEHCMLLVGYDNTRYYFNDPYRGRVLSFDKSIVAQRYARMGKQALVII